LKPEFFIALTTCPNNDIATQLAQAVVEKQLAACVNIVPGIQSVYQWQGKIENDSEFLLMMKTNRDKIESLQTYILEQHPYEITEFITLNIESGSAAYLDWINSSLSNR